MSQSSKTPAAALIVSEIEREGPMLFERFMQLALYAPDAGYYVRGRDPFGPRGDFFTAEQLQPVFGTLIAQFASGLRRRMKSPVDFRVVELGAGRGEMAAALDAMGYTAIDVTRGEMPREITGMVFANEFFDALPVGLAVRRGETFRQVRVAQEGGRFVFIDAEPVAGAPLEYLDRHYGGAEDGAWIEIHLRGLEWLDRIAAALSGYLAIVDYGYTAREWVRHRAGTLMSYRRHTASEDVLDDPGNRDITAHVPFSVFERHLLERGFEIDRFETLAKFLLSVGETDQFAAALSSESATEAIRKRMQLKTLLYSMGETFRVLVASKIATQ